MGLKKTVLRDTDGIVTGIKVEITVGFTIADIYPVIDGVEDTSKSLLSEWTISDDEFTATKIYTTKTKEIIQIANEASGSNFTIDVNPETVYLHCGSKCKHPAYTMEELDDKFDNLFLKGNLSKITGKLSTTDDYNSGVAYGSTSISYPTGFSRENCFVVGVKACITPASTSWAYQTGYGTSRYATGAYKAILNNPSVELSADKININLATDSPVSSIPYEILLMKY